MSFDPENECFKQVEQDMMHRLQTFFNEKITGLVTVKDRSILEERNRFDSLNESMLEIQNENVALEKEIERLQKLSENDSHTINDLGSQVFHKDAEIRRKGFLPFMSTTEFCLYFFSRSIKTVS